MSYEKKTPVILLCCGSFNPVTVGHVKLFGEYDDVMITIYFLSQNNDLNFS